MSLSKKITEYRPFPEARIFIAPTQSKDVVTIVGSILGGENMLPRSLEEVAGMAAELLDAGTSKKSKDVLRNSLASRGAQVSFSAGGDRTYFSGSCLPEDIEFLLLLVVECLDGSIFPISELTVLKERVAGELLEEKTDTRTQASAALSRLIYDIDNVNYVTPTSVRMKEIVTVSRANLLKYKSMLGKGGLTIAIVGDITISQTQKAVEKAFKKMGTGTELAPAKKSNSKKAEGSEQKIVIPDKANIDVYFGGGVPLTSHSELYIPFITLSNMLGGRGFANHLMRTLRERDSLTYVAYAYPTGFQDGAEGYLRMWAAFSPEIYEKGVSSLRKEVEFFLKKGITNETMHEQQDRMVGASLISLSTTKGLAHALHSIGVEGRDLTYIDEYPELIKAVSLSELQEVASLIHLDKLSLAAAGTFTK